MAYDIDIKITGVAPFLFNRFTEEQKADMSKSRTGGRMTTDQRQAEALRKVYRNDKGLFYPAYALKKCLLVGINRAKLKEGRASMMPYVQATCFIKPIEVPFDKAEPDFIHEATGRRPPRTGGACIILRPGLKEGWTLTFALQVLDDRRDADQLKRAWEEAGLLAGIGDWHPEFGRFIVTEWHKK